MQARDALKAFLLFLCIAAHSPAHPAEMHVTTGADGLTYIKVEGDFEIGDDTDFIKLALPLDKATVSLNSNGGNLSAGLGIGRAIRLKEFFTLVPVNGICASACGLAWLGGVRRYVSDGSSVGFHAAYIEKDGESKETGMGNALAGAYLNQLGLTQSAIAYVTEAAPQSMKWLTEEEAESLGIEMTVVSSREPAPIEQKTDSRITQQAPVIEPQFTDIKRIQAADIFGFDFPSMPINNMTLETCEKTCANNLACKAYTFKPGNSMCFLKSDGSQVLLNPLAQTGYKVEIESKLHKSTITLFERTDLPGGDYESLRNMTLEQCARTCEYDRKCLSFSYVQRRGNCWVKSVVPTSISNKIVISGVKGLK